MEAWVVAGGDDPRFFYGGSRVKFIPEFAVAEGLADSHHVELFLYFGQVPAVQLVPENVCFERGDFFPPGALVVLDVVGVGFERLYGGFEVDVVLVRQLLGLEELPYLTFSRGEEAAQFSESRRRFLWSPV